MPVGDLTDVEFGTLQARLDADWPAFKTQWPSIAALPSVSVSADVTANEGNSGSTAFNFTVTRSAGVAWKSYVHWAVTGSGANPANAADFGGTLPSGDIVFAATETSKTVTVNVSGDATVEPNEGFTLTLSAPLGCTIATASKVGTITNDDSSGAFDPTTLNATNTGAVLGGAMTSVGGYNVWNMTRGSDGYVLIQNQIISGRLTIQQNKVRVKNCIIDGGFGTNDYAIRCDPAFDYSDLIVEYCEISRATNGIGGAGTFTRNNIHDVNNGIILQGGNGVATENYIHDLNFSGSGTPHYDCIENNGGGVIHCYRNRCINGYNQTSAIQMNNEFGSIAGQIIDGNYLEGGGYTIYADNGKNGSNTISATITNNIIKAGFYGTSAFYTSGVSFGSGNTFI